MPNIDGCGDAMSKVVPDGADGSGPGARARLFIDFIARSL